MKKLPLLACVVFMAFTACKKERAQPEFSLAKSNYYLTESVNFTNKSTNAKSYTWDFGDGQTSTETNPVHAYSKAGIYQVKLSADNVTFTKSLKIYPGTASYQVFNQTTASVPLVSFGIDASSQPQDLKEHGTMAPNTKSDTVFTSYTQIYLGGFIGSQVFIAIVPHNMTKFGHSSLAINNNTQIYVGTTSVSASVSGMRGTTGKALNTVLPKSN